MDIKQFNHVVWCDLEIIILKIHSISSWDTKMVCSCHIPGSTTPIINIYICHENDSVFDCPQSYREKIMRQGLFRGHHFGQPAGLKHMDDYNIAISHPDPGKIIWCYLIKYLLTLHSVRRDMLHIKGGAVALNGKSFLILGRGGSGKTEIINELCKNGASFMGNTHLLVDDQFAYGIKSNIRVRENGRDIYVPVDQLHNGNVYGGWLPIGGILWVNYRTDGQTIIKEIPVAEALPNLQWFAESVGNWELKEDIADYCNLDPFAFAAQINKINTMLNNLCTNNSIYFLNTDIFSADGFAKTISLLESIS